jgi:hypothetical protein
MGFQVVQVVVLRAIELMLMVLLVQELHCKDLGEDISQMQGVLQVAVAVVRQALVTQAILMEMDMVELDFQAQLVVLQFLEQEVEVQEMEIRVRLQEVMAVVEEVLTHTLHTPHNLMPMQELQTLEVAVVVQDIGTALSELVQAVVVV